MGSVEYAVQRPVLDVKDLSFEYVSPKSTHKAIESLGFSVHEGEFVSIVGPSGSGKSTLLRLIAGLIQSPFGEINVAGQQVRGTVPKDIAIVFQDYSRSLFPWMSVRKNVAFPLKDQCSKEEAAERSIETLEAVGLGKFRDKYPWQLSGGMQQRVAIARALAFRPKLLLMDEPLASVDAQTRADLEDLILNVHQRFETTVLFITHDIDESVYLSDRVIILSPPPARLVKILSIPLSRPRDQLTTRQSEDFVRLRSEIASHILRT